MIDDAHSNKTIVKFFIRAAISWLSLPRYKMFIPRGSHIAAELFGEDGLYIYSNARDMKR